MNELKFFEAVNLIDNDIVNEARESDNVADVKETGVHDGTVTVSGVSVYKSRRWHTIAAAASMVIVAAAICSGAVLMLRRAPEVPPHDTENMPVIKTDVRTEASAASGEDTTEYFSDSETTTAVSTYDKEALSKQMEKEQELLQKEIEEAQKKAEEAYTDEVKRREAETQEQIDRRSAEEQQKILNVSTTAHVTAPPPENVSYGDPPEMTVTTAVPEPYVSEPCIPGSTDLFVRLNSLPYTAETCDGLPEFQLTAPDGTTFQVNLSSGWIWRNWQEEAKMDRDVIVVVRNYINDNDILPLSWN